MVLLRRVADAGVEAVFVEDVHDVGVVAAGGDDELLIAVGADGECAGAGQPVLRRDDGDHRVRAQRDPLPPAAEHAAVEAQIHPVLVHQPVEQLVVALHELDLHAGEIPVEPADDRRQPVRGDAVIRADAHLAGQDALDLGADLPQPVVALHQIAQRRDELLTVRRQVDAAPRADEQGEAELLLQRVDQVDHAGGRIVPCGGSGRKAAAVGDGEENFIAVEIHDASCYDGLSHENEETVVLL